MKKSRGTRTLVRWWMAALLVTTGVQVMRPQGCLLLVGGGSEDSLDWSDQPYQWFVEHAPNRIILVLHYSTTSTFLSSYFRRLGAVSATSIVIGNAATANDSSTYKSILAADGIFLRGGDQLQYINRWKGTLAEQAIREVYQRGGVIGGTSAGSMVLGDVDFDARLTSVDPQTALRNPLASGITFSEGFLPLLPGYLVDTHFYERGRLGRLLAMLAVRRENFGGSLTGLGVDYNTALAVGSDLVGEVMGSGTVTLLRCDEGTSWTLKSGEPLSIRRARFDQLTAGYRVDLLSGRIMPPPSAFSFAPVETGFPSGEILLDGSADTSDWSASLDALNALLLGQDTVTVITASSIGPSAQAVVGRVADRGNIGIAVGLDGATANDPSVAGLISAGKALVCVGGVTDSLGCWLGPATTCGQAFRERLASGVPLLFLGNDTKAAADSGTGRVEFHMYAAYYGYLTRFRGLSVLRGLEIMPRLYENDDFIDNRASGILWGQPRSRSRFGVLLDEESAASIRGGEFLPRGLTPAIVIEAGTGGTADFATWRDPGKAAPRQHAALTHATVHVLRQGDILRLTDGLITSLQVPTESRPSGLRLDQNYPNPFNSGTIIRYHLPGEEERSAGGHVRLSLFDVIGREVLVLVDAVQGSGEYAVTLDASRLASGVYLCHLRTGIGTLTRKLTILR
jgi:cyanophycinase